MADESVNLVLSFESEAVMRAWVEIIKEAGAIGEDSTPHDCDTADSETPVFILASEQDERPKIRLVVDNEKEGAT